MAAVSIGCATSGNAIPDGPEAPAEAWWYAIEFEPLSSDVHGIPVVRFDPAWRRASALNMGGIAEHLPDQALARYEGSGFSFETRSDLDGDGMQEEIFVGVYENDTGGEGRFLAVTRNGHLIQHFEHPGVAGFSALVAAADGIRWYKCMQCGEFEVLRWSGRSYVLE